MPMTLTDEQAAARDLFRGGGSLAIEAGAGTGKTSTLVALAKAEPKRLGQYVAFNKSIVSDAGAKLPSTVSYSTAHGLAFRAVGRHYADRLRGGRMPSREIARRLGVQTGEVVHVMGTQKRIQPSTLAGWVMRAVSRFCQTADREPAEWHFPYLEGIDEPGPGGVKGTRNNDALRRLLLPALRKAWADVLNPAGELPYKHEHYLKCWELGEPRIDADYILFDECQDANPVMVSVVVRQEHAQQIWVGDSNQEVYSFIGAVNALATIPTDNRAFLSQSFRFGPEIAETANTVLEKLDAELRLLGSWDLMSRVEPVGDPHAVLCRTNATAVDRVLAAQKMGRRPHLVGGGTEVLSFARAAVELRERGWTPHPELQCFTSWSQVQDYISQDQLGGELKLLVDLVDSYGPEVIIGALEHMPAEPDADLIVSTAHKSKGREWESVQPADDFPAEDLEPQDWRLLYVAATRARDRLDVTRVGVLHDAEAVSADRVADAAEPVTLW